MARFEHETYHTIQKVKTFTPASSQHDFIFAQLAKNIENACIKLRKYQLATERVLIFLRSQDFHDTGLEMDLSGPTSFPNDILRVVSPAFDDLLASGTLYRVAYSALADNVPGPLPSRLCHLTQPVMSPPNRFSTPLLTLLACI